jgi:pyruvate formate-lyase activating enzyme-like uncharacterized protein
MTGREMQELPAGSIIIGSLPRGCQLCAEGKKMLLFVTGLCESSCYYCPLSQEKAGKDVVFADEMPVTSDGDVLSELVAIGAEGAGLSGGDPLCAIRRAAHYIELLKQREGSSFHIHLYTSKNDCTRGDLLQLVEAGLDEIRFHPQGSDWSGIESAVELGLDVGLEVPVIPGQERIIKDLILRAEKTGLRFVNLNELEASETNFGALVALGMELTSLDAASIAGSHETAVEVLEWAREHTSHVSVHFCTAKFKDSVQLRNRLARRAERTIRGFEEQDESEPLLIVGVIRAPYPDRLNDQTLVDLGAYLTNRLDVPEDMMSLDFFRKRIEIAPWILEEISSEIRKDVGDMVALEIGIAYEYPSWDRMQTLFEPI